MSNAVVAERGRAGSEDGPGEVQVRVALCGLSDFLRDIVSVLVRDVPDVEVVAHLQRSRDLREDFDRSGADVLICALGDREMEEWWMRSLARRPPIAVLNLASSHTVGRFYALCPEKHDVEPLTASSLVEALTMHVQSLRFSTAHGEATGAPSDEPDERS